MLPFLGVKERDGEGKQKWSGTGFGVLIRLFWNIAFGVRNKWSVTAKWRVNAYSTKYYFSCFTIFFTLVSTHASRWFSPESMATQTNFSHESHVWQLGICFWEIFSRGQMPYNEVTDTLGKINRI